MNAEKQPIEISPEIKVTISAKLLWAGLIGLVAIIGTYFVTYYDIKESILKQGYEINQLQWRVGKMEDRIEKTK